ncbi:hypothetical protein SH501x_004619 [Pirellulaceae bacterium SH501]|jgi:hypothetical protein
MGLNESEVNIKEIWRLEDGLQFRQIHSIGNAKFLLSGGLDVPTWPQQKLRCAQAVLDVDLRSFIWRTELNNHKVFDFSCATQTRAIGCIPNKFKSETCGLISFDLVSGTKIADSVEIAGIMGLAATKDDDFCFIKCDGVTCLCTNTSNQLTTTEISCDKFFRASSLLGFDEKRVVCVMQHTFSAGGRGQIEFAHQLRELDGQLKWEHRTLNDTCAKLSDFALLTYSNAGDGNRNELEVISTADGRLIGQISLSSSVANVTPLSETLVLLCSPYYEMCVLDLRTQQIVYKIALPNKCPGWLCFSVDAARRLILACKANNFMDPRSTLVAFSY